jgi:F-type H+-transporting ATPase subunit gamma
MATLKQIRQRIKTAKNIRQITRAMKLVAAARLRRATERVMDARPYSEKMQSFMSSLAAAGDLPSHPLMEKREVKNVCLILVTADRGLSGPYNSSLIRKAEEFVRNSSSPVQIIGYGKKGFLYFTKRGHNVVKTINMPSAGATLADAIQVANEARRLYESEAVDAVYVIYSKFYSAIRQVPQVVQLLPIEPPTGDEGGSGYAFEPDAAGLLNALLPRYFLTLVQQAMFEGTASFFGSQMTAMTAATDNAGKMINELTLRANRERQAAITKEILEVVGGAEALKA